MSIRNDGTTSHSLEVKGEGFGQKVETNLQPGESRLMTLMLKPGVYTAFCPVAGHDTLHGAPSQITITE